MLFWMFTRDRWVERGEHLFAVWRLMLLLLLPFLWLCWFFVPHIFFPSRYYILVGKTSSLSLLCVSTWCAIVGVSYALAYFKFSNIPYSHISTYENLMHGNPVWYTCYIPTHRPHSFLISHFFFTHYLLPRRNIIPYICCVCAFFDFTSLSFSISILSFGFMTFYVFSPGFALQLFFLIQFNLNINYVRGIRCMLEIFMQSACTAITSSRTSP